MRRTIPLPLAKVKRRIGTCLPNWLRYTAVNPYLIISMLLNPIKQAVRQLNAHHRVIIALIVGVLTHFLLTIWLPPSTSLISAWDTSASVYLILSWITIAGADSAATRISTQTLRQSGKAIMVVVLGAAFISVGALAFLFKTTHDASFWQKTLHVTLSFLALGLSWLLIHTRFAFHYAHLYYVGAGRQDKAAAGGLNFPGEREPDYLDFAYFSFVIGMTSQTSDVAVTSRLMRRVTLAHGVLAFGFNVVVVALSVNIFASLVA